MKISDVRVGMKLRSTYEFDIFSPVTVTEITEKGFKYSCEPRTIKTGYNSGIPQFGQIMGGEYYADENGEVRFEEITQTDYSI